MIQSISIKNFKKIGEAGITLSNLGKVNYLVGENGCGKSSILDGLQLLNIGLISRKTELSKSKDIGHYLKYFLSVGHDHSKKPKRDAESFIEITTKDNQKFTFKNILNSDQINIERPSNVFDIKINLIQCSETSTIPFEKILSLMAMGLSVRFTSLIEEMIDGNFIKPQYEGDESMGFSYDTRGPVPELKSGSDVSRFSGGRMSILNLIYRLYELINKGNKVIILIEEPEFCMHPQYQKQIPFILDQFISLFPEKDIQLIVTTHSPFIISEALKNNNQKIYHISDGQGVSDFDRTDLSKNGLTNFDNILSNLGFEMKDIYYPNCLIYVEGPTDIIYIQKRLDLYVKENNKKSIIRGLDYDFVIFGGAIASWYSVDNSINEIDINNITGIQKNTLINLLGLNRKVFFVTDDDRGDSGFEKAKEYIQSQIKLINNGSVFFKDINIKTIEDYMINGRKFWYRNRSNKAESAIKNMQIINGGKQKRGKREEVNLGNSTIFDSNLINLLKQLYQFIEQSNTK